VGGSILVYMLGQPGNSYIDVFFSTTWLANSVVMGITVMSGAFLAAGTFGLLPLLLAGPTTAAGSGPSAEIVAGIATVLIMMINPGGVATMTRFVRRQATVHGGDVRPPFPGEPNIAAEPPEVALDAGELTGASLRLGGSEPRRPETREGRLPEGAEP
jgi:hypothetical protein